MFKKTLIATLVSLSVISTAYAAGHHVVSHHKKNVAVVTSANPLDLNTATVKDLEMLPHVGPAMAARIVQYRQKNGQFKTVGALAQVKGIASKRLLAWKGLVNVGQRKHS